MKMLVVATTTFIVELPSEGPMTHDLANQARGMVDSFVKLGADSAIVHGEVQVVSVDLDESIVLEHRS